MADAVQQFTTTAIPGATGIGEQQNAAKLAYQNTITKLNSQRQSLARNAGYNIQFDPTSGHIQKMDVDGGNTFGGYQQLLRGAALNDQHAANAMQERGIHGGLANKGVSGARYDNQLGLTQFGSGLQGGFSDLEGQQQDASTDYNNAMYEAELQAARDAIANQQYNATNYDGLNYDPYGDDSAPDETGSTYSDDVVPPPDPNSPKPTGNKLKLPKAKTSGLGGAAGMALLNPGTKGHNAVTTKKVVQAAIKAAKPTKAPPKPAPKLPPPKPKPKGKK